MLDIILDWKTNATQVTLILGNGGIKLPLIGKIAVDVLQETRDLREDSHTINLNAGTR